MAYKNTSGYNDPTAGKAMATDYRQHYPVERYVDPRQKAAQDLYEIIKKMVGVAGFELKTPMMLLDTQDGRKHYLPKAP